MRNNKLNKIWRSKKALNILMPGLLILLIISLTWLFIIFNQKGGNFPRKLGEKEFSIIKTAALAESSLDYIELSAKYAVDLAYQDFIKNSGSYVASECGSYRGSPILFSNSEDCLQDTSKIEESFLEYFNLYMNQYLQNFDKLYIPRNSFDLQISQNKITAESTTPITIPIISVTSAKLILDGNSPSVFELLESVDDESPLAKLKYSCQPVTEDIFSGMKYSEFVEKAKEVYGSSEQSIESQAVITGFMGKRVQIHEKIVPLVSCIEYEISNCAEAQNYEFYSVGGFYWRNARGSTMLSPHAFGIAIDINPYENPMCLGYDPKGYCGGQVKLVTDIPQCVVNAFKRYGFDWGGDWSSSKDAMHFEFRGDPETVKYTIIDKTYDKTSEYFVPPASAGWNIVIKAIDDNFGAIIDEKILQYGHTGIKKSYVVGVMAQESSGNPDAVSPTGCKGLMQFCGSAAKDYNLDDPFDPEEAIRAGVQYLSDLMKYFKDKGYSDYHEFALASYNGGSGVIMNAISATGESDPSWQTVSEHITPDLITYFKTTQQKQQKVEEITKYVPGVHSKERHYAENFAGHDSVIG